MVRLVLLNKIDAFIENGDGWIYLMYINRRFFLSFVMCLAAEWLWCCSFWTHEPSRAGSNPSQDFKTLM